MLSIAKSSFSVPMNVSSGIEHDAVVGDLGDRAAGGDRQQPRAAPAAQPAVDLVAVDQRAAAAAPRGEAVGRHRDDRVEVVARRGRGTARRAATSANSSSSRVVAARGFGDDLLREHVERRVVRRRCDRARRVRTDAQQRGAFDQVVARDREQPALRRAGDRVARSADALQKRGDPVRRADLADQIDVPDVDAELERRGGDQRLELPAFEPRLGVEPLLLRQAAVMRRDRVVAEPLAQVPRHAARPSAAC